MIYKYVTYYKKENATETDIYTKYIKMYLCIPNAKVCLQSHIMIYHGSYSISTQVYMPF